MWVVTRDPEVAALARSLGAEPLAEPDNRGHTAAVATAQAEAVRQGATAFLTIPGDVPCVSAAEIRALVDALAGAAAVVLTPSRSGLGTNGVVLSPPSAMRLRFGEPSFDDHVVAARALRLDVSDRARAGAGPRRGRARGSEHAARRRARPPRAAACSPSWQITERLVAAGAVARH